MSEIILMHKLWPLFAGITIGVISILGAKMTMEKLCNWYSNNE